MPRLLLLLVLAACRLAAATLDLLHISDTHVAEHTGAHPEIAKARALHRDSLGKLQRFVETVNAGPPARVVVTGDIVDAVCLDGAAGAPVYGQIDGVARAFASLRRPYHLVLGNHDVECYRRNAAKPESPAGDQSVAADTRRRWARAVRSLKQAYYSPSLGRGYRLLVLDNGQALDTPGAREYMAKQMQWFRRELQRRRRDRVIVALHIPLAADERSQIVRAELDRSTAVQLILCGHRHTDGLEWLPSAGRRVLQVRTAALYLNPANARRIRLHPGRIEVSATTRPDEILETVRF